MPVVLPASGLTVCGSFQKNYLKRTFAASKSAFSIMSYESITAACLFAGRACSTHPPSPPVPPRLRPCTLLTLPPPHFLQPCGLCMGGSLCCQFLALPHPHPPLRSFGGCYFQKKLSKTHFYSLEKCIFDDVLEKYCCWLTVCRSFQKNYLKRTFAASKSAFSIMSYESITAGCLFAGRACSTHPPSPPVPPRLRPCTLLTLPPPHFLQPCGLCMGGSLCCQFLALPTPTHLYAALEAVIIKITI